MCNNYLKHGYSGLQYYKVFDRNFLFIEMVQAFSDFILSRALGICNLKRRETSRYCENLNTKTIKHVAPK